VLRNDHPAPRFFVDASPVFPYGHPALRGKFLDFILTSHVTSFNDGRLRQVSAFSKSFFNLAVQQSLAHYSPLDLEILLKCIRASVVGLPSDQI
jgi:hypothetical protein